MFGYIITNVDELTIEEKQQYGACYCGLCKTLKERHGSLGRLVLTYDMTFIVIFLSSLYKKNNKVLTDKCIMHPFKSHKYWQNEITEYAADMNIILAYYKFIDDWIDDRKLLSLFESKLLISKYEKIKKQYENRCILIDNYLKELLSIEKSGVLNPDIPANCFGKLAGELFIMKEDEYSEDLRAFGYSLGKFIYIMDACIDLKEDIKHERYNPLIASSSENFHDILNLLMADCIDKYEHLPINRDKKLIENILYSGIWTKYEAEKHKSKEDYK